eukprot:gene14796-31438_t
MGHEDKEEWEQTADHADIPDGNAEGIALIGEIVLHVILLNDGGLLESRQRGDTRDLSIGAIQGSFSKIKTLIRVQLLAKYTGTYEENATNVHFVYYNA